MGRRERDGRGRIVIVTNRLMMGGAEKQIVSVMPYLIRAGFEVRVLSILPSAAYQEEVERLGVSTTELRLVPGLRGLSAVVGATRVLRDLEPDAIVSFVYQANVLGRIAGRLARVPVIISSIRNEHFGHPRRARLLRATDRLATLTTTNSELVARRLIAQGVVPQGRLRVIPNGIDVSAFDKAAQPPCSKEELGFGPDSFVWLAVGRLEPQKDFATLLDAFALHASRHPQAGLCLVGDGPQREGLEQQAHHAGVAERVRFVGIRMDLPRLVAGSDAFVLSSAWEGLPNALMEAMAASKPVVATGVGGVPELVDEGKTGFLVPPRDAVSLAASMDRMVSLEDGDREAMGHGARREVVGRFSLEAAAQQWVELLHAFVAKRPAEV